MLDLCLLIPPSPWMISDHALIPLGILYLAAYVRIKGYSVQILDFSNNKTPNIPSAKYYGLGFTSPQFVHALELKNKIKELYPTSLIIAGGAHPTAIPENVLLHGFDAVVRGEGENSIIDILKNGITKKIYELSYITDINDLPFPAWDLINLEEYISNLSVFGYLGSRTREINMMATRGCTGKCSYCTKFKGPLRWRTVLNVISELDILINKYRVDRISFCDDNIIIKKSFLTELCFELKKRNIHWHCLGRADQLKPNMCRLMADSGCMGIDLGIESGSQKLLDVIKKNTTVEKQELGLRMAAAAGLKVRAQIIVGLPTETNEDHNYNIAFIKRNLQYVSKWGIHSFIPFPTCDIWYNPESYNYVINKSTDFSDFQTIGKPGEWKFSPPDNAVEIEQRREELIKLAADKNIFIEEYHE